MKKLLLLCVFVAVASLPVQGSTLIYKGRVERRTLEDASPPPEPILVGDKFRQIRIVVVRTTAALARPSAERPGFGIAINSEYENTNFSLFRGWSADPNNWTHIIDTPPPLIQVIPHYQVGTFAIFVWAS